MIDENNALTLMPKGYHEFNNQANALLMKMI